MLFEYACNWRTLAARNARLAVSEALEGNVDRTEGDYKFLEEPGSASMPA
jgi:hypothetical protein